MPFNYLNCLTDVAGMQGLTDVAGVQGLTDVAGVQREDCLTDVAGLQRKDCLTDVAGMQRGDSKGFRTPNCACAVPCTITHFVQSGIYPNRTVRHHNRTVSISEHVTVQPKTLVGETIGEFGWSKNLGEKLW